MISKHLYDIITIEKEGEIMQAEFLIDRIKSNKIELLTLDCGWCLPEFHPAIEIWGITNGKMELTVGGKQKTLEENSFMFLPPFTIHESKRNVRNHSFVIIIPTCLCENFMKAIEGKKITNYFFEDPILFQKIKFLFDLMKEENVSELRKTGLANAILGYILENGKFVDSNNESNTELITKILLYINNNFNKNISLKSIAEHFGFSQNFISNHFKTHCGISLKRYITLVRLKNAILLMQNPNNKMTFCALECGFTSMRTFYRSFQEEFGCSPKTYVANLR